MSPVEEVVLAYSLIAVVVVVVKFLDYAKYPLADGLLWPVILIRVLLVRLFQIACGKL